MNVTDFMRWANEGYTTLKVAWIAASKAFSNSLNDVNALGQSNLKEHVSQRSFLKNRIRL